METIQRSLVLDQIKLELTVAAQWKDRINTDCAGFYVRGLHKAEALIELLEIADCGSVGGFDKGQPRPRNLLDRYEWLRNKHNSADAPLNDVLIKAFGS